MATVARDFPIISADAHFTEPADLWLNYIEPKYKARAPHVEHQPTTDVFVCDTGKMFTVGVMHGIRYKGGDVKHEGRYADIPAAGWDAKARLPDMEKDGIYAEVLYPTVAMRFFTIEDVAFGEACVRAYNTWAADFCKAYPDRFKSIAVIMLDDVDHAVEELKRCKAMGHAGAMISVFPDDARPYHDDLYAPFWNTAAELGLPVSLHVSTERRIAEKPKTPTEQFLGYTAVQKVIIGMIYAGVFDRIPTLQVVSAENDAGWAGNLIERMDYFHDKARARNLRGAGNNNKKRPGDYWRTQVSYTFMRDLTAVAARHVIGVDRIMWSSDYPHGDSTFPNSREVIEEHMQGVPLAEQRMILHDNAKRTYGF